MKTMTEILTIPALGTERDTRCPKRTVRWSTLAGARTSDKADGAKPDDGAGAFLPSQTGLIILVVE